MCYNKIGGLAPYTLRIKNIVTTRYNKNGVCTGYITLKERSDKALQ
jgi:hypothetical protein